MCFFGLQYILKKWMVGKVVTEEMLADAKAFYKDHFRGLDIFNEAGWRHIIKVCVFDRFFFNACFGFSLMTSVWTGFVTFVYFAVACLNDSTCIMYI